MRLSIGSIISVRQRLYNFAYRLECDLDMCYYIKHEA